MPLPLLRLNGHDILNELDLNFISGLELCEHRNIGKVNYRICEMRNAIYDMINVQFFERMAIKEHQRSCTSNFLSTNAKSLFRWNIAIQIVMTWMM